MGHSRVNARSPLQLLPCPSMAIRPTVLVLLRAEILMERPSLPAALDANPFISRMCHDVDASLRMQMRLQAVSPQPLVHWAFPW